MTTLTNLPLAGKTALVTGASRGIGAGVAQELARQGAHVAITYWSSPERAETVVSEIIAAGGSAVAIRANNAEATGARQGVRDAAAQLGSRIETGTVFANRCDYLDPTLVWTGVKDTGKGGALSEIGYANLTQPKSYHLKRV